MVADDLNDSVGYLGARPGVMTPNIDQLAQRGVWFTRAYVQAPLCNASRVSFMTGLLPSSTGVYDNGNPWKYACRDLITLPQYFTAHGYRSVTMGGKVYHYPDPSSWNDSYDCGSDLLPPTIPANGLAGLGYLDWAGLTQPDIQMSDGAVSARAAEFVSQTHAQPFFLAVGYTKPHAPWYVPQHYFDLYPLEDIVLPPINPDDQDDLPPLAMQILYSGSYNYNLLVSQFAMRDMVRAYYASVALVDTQVGVVLDALNNGPNANNTIVVFLGDNGFHLGEKLYVGKYTLWEEANRVPFVVAGPGISQGQACDRVVSAIDLYPTLVELAGLPPKSGLEGRSLAPLLADPQMEWNHPAISTWLQNQHTVRTERWRYIRYRDGSEELYDHDADPHEWTNLAPNTAYDDTKASLAAYLPTVNVAAVTSTPHILYVDANASGIDDGKSWENAFTDLQKAIAVANASVSYGASVSTREIWVAEGTYHPDVPGGDREKSFRLFRPVSIYGGFAGNEANRIQRNPVLHKTILSGDLNGDDGPGFTNRSDNSYHVIFSNACLPDAVLNGFYITGGNADGADWHNLGGGAYLDHTGPSIVNCWFVDNHADYGGAVYNSGGGNSVTLPTFLNCVIASNSAAISGGAMYNDWLAPHVINCRSSSAGGARPFLCNCDIVGNIAPAAGGINSRSTAYSTIRNTIIWGNQDNGGSNQAAQIQGAGYTVKYCCIQGYYGGPGFSTWNFGANPAFVDPVGQDGVPYSGDENLSLLPGSPCIDAGSNTDLPLDTDDSDGDLNTSEPYAVDLDGQIRLDDDPLTANAGNVIGPVVDIGAYEYQSPVPDPCPLDGDLNRDDLVDGRDIQVMVDCVLNRQSPLGDCGCSDVYPDGYWDLLDAEALVAILVPPPPPPCKECPLP